MKYLLLLTTLLHSTLSLAYTTKIDFDGYKFKEMKKSNSLLIGGMGKLKKKAPKLKSFNHSTSNYKYHPRKTHLEVVNVESTDPRFLKVRIDSKKIDEGNLDKYEAFKVLYNLKSTEDFSSFEGVADVEVVNGERYITLDIFPLEPGDYIASLQIQAYKSQHKNKKNVYTFNLSFSFERPVINSAHLVADNYLNLAGNAAVYFDTAESFSDFGEITGFRYETYLNGVLKEDLVTQFTFTRAVIRFREVGDWTIKITAIDSLGTEDSQEFNFNVTNTVPTINYSYTLDPNVPGHFTIDLSDSSDPDGIRSYESFYYKVNDDGSLNYWKYLNHGDSITTNLVNRGNNYICVRVTDNTGAFDVQCFYIEFNQNIAPYHFFNFYEPVDYDERTWYFESFCFDNDGSPAKYNFRATTTYNGEEFVVEQESSGSGMDITFPRPGEWSIESTCTDNDGAVSNVNRVTDFFDFDLGMPEMFLDFFPVNNKNTDLVYNAWVSGFPSPYASSVSFIFEVYQNGNFLFDKELVGDGVIEFPSAGSYRVDFYAIDDLGLTGIKNSISVNINAKPIANYQIQKDFSGGYDAYVISSQSQDPDGSIERTEVSANNLTNGQNISFEFFGNTSPISLVEGFWNVSIVAVDNLDGKSEPYQVSFDIVNQRPIADFTFSQKDNDPFTYVFSSNSSDDGIISKYIVKNNQTIIGEFSSSPFDITVDMAENNIEITAIDETGLESNPWTTTINIEKPVIDFNIIAVNPPYEYRLDFNVVSITGNDTISKYMIYTDNNVYEISEATFTLPIYSDSGTYTISVLGKTQLGIDSESVSKSITVTYPKIGEDIVPPDPGEEGDIGLVGIDVDQDGVRDDVEVEINSIFNQGDNNLRNEVLKLAKEFQALSSIPPEELNSINSSEYLKQELSFVNCLEKKISSEETKEILNKIIELQYNNDERRIFYFKILDVNNGVKIDEVNINNCGL